MTSTPSLQDRGAAPAPPERCQTEAVPRRPPRNGATGTLLRALRCSLCEHMLFGLGKALGFAFLNPASLPLPFVGGRSCLKGPERSASR